MHLLDTHIERKSPRKGTKIAASYSNHGQHHSATLKESPQERGRKFSKNMMISIGFLLKESPQERGRKLDLLGKPSPSRWLKESPQERGRKYPDGVDGIELNDLLLKESPQERGRKYQAYSALPNAIHWKKVPKKGDEKVCSQSDVHDYIHLIERKSPRKGTKSCRARYQ